MSRVRKINLEEIAKKEALITQLFLNKLAIQKEILKQKKELRILGAGLKSN